MFLSLSLMFIFVVNDWRAIGVLSLYQISHSDFLRLIIVCLMNGCQSGKNSLWCWRNRISDSQKNSDRTSIIEGRSLFQQLSQLSEIPEQHSRCLAFSGQGFKRLLELSCFNYSLDHINSFLDRYLTTFDSPH
jgi:hypothetical protein